MRVLHVMECTIGGTRRHLRDVARGQVEAGLDVHLVVSAEREPRFREDLAELAERGCAVHELPMVRAIRPGTDAGHYRAVRALLERTRPDVVHTHSSKAGVLGRLASSRTGIGRRVHTPHTFAFLFREMFGPLKRSVFYRLERWLAARTDRLVAVSESEARTFRASGVVAPERVAVVPNGIDPAPFAEARPLDPAALGLDPRRPVVVVIGLFNAAKGQDLALEALRAPGCEEVQLVFAGDGPPRPELEARAAEQGSSARVRFLGWRDDVPALLATADLALLPSRWEGMPYVVLEANACGRPVVATPVDGARDLVRAGETGWLADELSGEALGRALAAALAAPREVRERLGRRAQAEVTARYTVSTMVTGLIELYRSIL